MSLAELESLLAPLLAEEGPVSALALELIAAKAYEEGDFARARKEFAFLQVAPNAPQGVITRAGAALAVIPVVTTETPQPAEPAESTSDQDEEGGQ